MNRMYRKGIRAEWELRDMLKAAGWVIISRGGGSRGIDLVAAKNGLLCLFSVKCRRTIPPSWDAREVHEEFLPLAAHLPPSAACVLALKQEHRGWWFLFWVGNEEEADWVVWGASPYKGRSVETHTRWRATPAVQDGTIPPPPPALSALLPQE